MVEAKNHANFSFDDSKLSLIGKPLQCDPSGVYFIFFSCLICNPLRI